MRLFADVSPKAATWDDVTLISERFCVSCHLDDGYETQATWSGLKDSMIKRLKLGETEAGTMPPSETKLGKEMGSNDKTVMLSWLTTIQATTPSKIPTGTSSPTTAVPIAGDLKSLNDMYCKSCHSDAVNTLFWSSKKALIISKVSNGAMPKGTAMTDADKRKLLAIVSAL
ncbi:MAG: hypothetical protein H7249_05095 [Chitinophagaceae bacterium]|nr:hypothetical protein [Oligoflexus sp.]